MRTYQPMLNPQVMRQGPSSWFTGQQQIDRVTYASCYISPFTLRTIGAVVHGGSTIFCSGSPVGCMKPWKFQVGYSEIGCEVQQFYLNVSILFVLLLSIQVNVISLVQK